MNVHINTYIVSLRVILVLDCQVLQARLDLQVDLISLPRSW